MNTVERILPVFSNNYPREVRGAIWNICMASAMKLELSESNLDNMCCTALVSGFVGDSGQNEIVKLSKAVGIGHNPDGITSDELLDKIQRVLPFQISFPPFHGNCLQGLQTKYGVTSNRHIWYLWVMKRIMELCPDRDSSIVEIGAGFGLLGYYLDKAGYRDYTTIDIAMAGACQTYFLTKNLPGRNIIISGDVTDPFDLRHKDSIKLLHSTDFKDVPKNRFSIMVNMDGLTEYGLAEASKYVQSDCAPMLLSINHEVNEFRVCEIAQTRKLKSRHPFWLRDGYFEELYNS